MIHDLVDVQKAKLVRRRVCKQAIKVLRNTGDSGNRAATVLDIVFAKHPDKEELLIEDPISEKAPCNGGKADCTKRIA